MEYSFEVEVAGWRPNVRVSYPRMEQKSSFKLNNFTVMCVSYACVGGDTMDIAV